MGKLIVSNAMTVNGAFESPSSDTWLGSVRKVWVGADVLDGYSDRASSPAASGSPPKAAGRSPAGPAALSFVTFVVKRGTGP